MKRFHSRRRMLLASVAVTFMATATSQAALVAYYDYNVAANLGLDTSGLGNNLVASGTPTSGAGVNGGGLELNGTNAMLVPSGGFPTGVPTGNSSYTIATWFNADVNGAKGMVGWGNYGSTNQVNALRLGNSGEIHNYWWANDAVVSGLGDLSAGAAPAGWHHVVATYDAASTQQVIYLDGTQVGAFTRTGHNVGAANFAVGRTFGTEFFDGQLDDTAIYNHALNATQVAALAANTATPKNFALVGLYRFEDGSNIGKDSSSYGNNLVAQGNAQSNGTGKFSNGLLLDGTGDFLSVNAGATAAPVGLSIGDSSYAIAAWFKPDAANNPQGQANGIVGWGNYGTNNEVTAIRMNGANGYSHYWWSSDQVVGGQPNSVDGQFHHIVAMYDAATGVRSLIVDGVIVASAIAPDHAAAFSNFTIGRTASGVLGLNEWFDGTLDDVAIFNRALTTQEIAAIRAGDFSAFGITIPEPATALTGMIGLAMLGLRRRRRQAA